jgi:hypothetical protein
MSCEEREVKIAFESDLDANTLTELLMGRVVERGGEDWASKSVCDLGTKLKIVRRPKRCRLARPQQRSKPNGTA